MNNIYDKTDLFLLLTSPPSFQFGTNLVCADFQSAQTSYLLIGTKGIFADPICRLGRPRTRFPKFPSAMKTHEF